MILITIFKDNDNLFRVSKNNNGMVLLIFPICYCFAELEKFMAFVEYFYHLSFVNRNFRFF